MHWWKSIWPNVKHAAPSWSRWSSRCRCGRKRSRMRPCAGSGPPCKEGASRAAIGTVLAALCALALIFWMGTARVPATTEQAQFWTYNRKENGADICILEAQGEGVWLDMEDTFSWGKPQITVRAMRYRFPGVHRVLTALVDSDRSTVWVMVSRTQLLTVDCADQTLYYRDGQLVDRYIVQENPDGTFDYAYGTDQEYGIDYKKG